MKQIFTLLSAISFTTFFATTNAQNVSTGFETQTEFNQLLSQCWQFNNVYYSAVNPISGTGNVQTTLNSTGEFVTPELVIPTTLTISFDYNLAQSNGGSKTLIVFLLTGTTETKLETINLQANPSGTLSGTYTNANTPGNNINGIRKLIFRTTANVSVQVDNLAINAPYAYTSGCSFSNITLPLKMTAFTGNLNNDKIRLQWSVEENESGHHFEIEKSINGSSFQKEEIIFATARPGKENYSFTAAVISNAVMYRIKMVNNDGSSSYSKVLSFSTGKSSRKGIDMLQNPVYNTLSFRYTAVGNGVYKVALYTPAGIKVFAKPVTMQEGSNTISLNIDCNLPLGSYVMEVSGAEERTTTMIVK